ncbi:restriction endonuclease subunit S [Ketobacter sp. GenoA1]|uniref:restriction endonuclease subunit S n=1 Tax=Ketobacter sp. GenoA1 TaxID=2072747 RepID=UPI000F26F1F2|nr:restriction endonuclease subunit S [Ketobacter sp. GenoA1]RLT90788.1 MAG: restriction endonuclease subunit S [Ketobacter sp. GenoA1]
MRIVSLSDIAEIVTGSTPSRADADNFGSDVPFITPSELDKGIYVTEGTEYLSNQGASLSRVIPEKSVMVCCIGSLGKVGIAASKLVTNQQINSLIVNEGLADPLYVYFFCRTLKPQLESMAPKTTVAIVNKSRFSSLKIPLPPLETQKQIAAILEKADQLRKDCQQMEQELNNLAQSVFMDMFGDPVSNPKGWERRKLSEFYFDEKTGTKCGPFGSALKKEDFSVSGVPVWNMDNITLSGKFIDQPTLWVPHDKYDELESYSVLPGDVIISRAGTVGKMGVVLSKYPESLISTNLIRVRFGERLLPQFFVSLMLYCKTRLKRLKVGADGAFSHMNTGILDELEFPYPPIDVQTKYANFVEKIDSELIRLKNLSTEMDQQFNSLSRKAFSGELTIKDRAA